MLGAKSTTVHKLRAELDDKRREVLRVREQHKTSQDEIRQLKQRISQLKSPSTGASSSTSSSSTPTEAALEGRLKRLTGQHASFRTEVARRLEEKTRALQLIDAENRRLRGDLAASRQSSGGGGEDVVLLKRRVRECEDKLKQMKANQLRNDADYRQMDMLTERCATHTKERRAILTIMEDKVKMLVDNVAKAAASIPAADGSSPLSSSRGLSNGVGGRHHHPSVLEVKEGKRLAHELQALSRLVNASIAALKNSSNNENNKLVANHGAPPPTPAEAAAGAVSSTITTSTSQQSVGGGARVLQSSSQTHHRGSANGKGSFSRHQPQSSQHNKHVLSSAKRQQHHPQQKNHKSQAQYSRIHKNVAKQYY